MAESTLSQISGDFTLVENSSSNLNGVIFHNVQAVYTADEAINCVYSITEDIDPEAGDVIGLFKVGWTSSSECLSSIPAKVPVNNDKQFLKSVFEAHLLPNDSSELYQFCYISKMRVVGASTPFTFEGSDIIAVEDPTDPGLLVFKSRVSQLKDELHKLSDEKTFYASKYKILYSNFWKLKSEFDNIEQELQHERENTKRLKEANAILNKHLKEKSMEDQSNALEDLIKPENSDAQPPSEVNKLYDKTNLTSEAMNSEMWKAMHEINLVATEARKLFKSQERGRLSQKFYQDLVDHILEVFTVTQRKLETTGSEKSEESRYCKCYFQQKKSCCPSLCSESEFEFMMTRPLYTCFSNFSHFSKDGSMYCDGSFDHNSLSDYVKTMVQTRKISSINLSEPESIPVEENNELNSHKKNIVTEAGNEHKSDNKHEINEERLTPSLDVISQMNEEREKVYNELKISKEKIASLNSRVNVLELELVAQQSSHLRKSELLSEDSSQVLAPSTSSVNTLDIESVLECVHNEYINLKDKYRELSKKIAKMYSLEAKCTALEKENAELIQYFTGIRDLGLKYSISTDQFFVELENLIEEKNRAKDQLISLQKECVGKISVNLIQQKKHQG